MTKEELEKEAEESWRSKALCYKVNASGRDYIVGFADGYNKAMNEIGRRTEAAHREGMTSGRDIAMEEIRPLRQDCVKLTEQLTEAKEIIKQFLNDYPVITKELLDKLEQFVKEIKEND